MSTIPDFSGPDFGGSSPRQPPPPPPPPPGPPGGYTPRSQNDALVPGILISVIAGLNAGLFGLAALMASIEAATGRNVISDSDQPPADFATVFIIVCVLAVSLVVLGGGIQMARRKMKTWAMISAVGMMIPCIGPCCFIGIPLGIWALVVINRMPPESWT